jgi:hypothetical protein
MGLSLNKVFENGRNVQTLILYDCSIKSLLGFNLDPHLDYKIKRLDLYKTAMEKKKSKLNNEKFEIIVSEFVNTSLKQSLELVFVELSSYDPEILQHLFDKYFMKTVVSGADSWPISQASSQQNNQISHRSEFSEVDVSQEVH